MTPAEEEEQLERRLVEEARGGSADAFCGLVRLHQARVNFFIATHLGTSEGVDDLAQDVFLVAYRHLASYRGESSLQHWLLGIARNRLLNHIRDLRRKRQAQRRSLQLLLTEARAAALEESPAEDARREREFVALKHCLEKLPAGSSDVVTAHYFERRALVDIAARLGKKESALRMTLFRVRQALRDCIRLRVAGEPT